MTTSFPKALRWYRGDGIYLPLSMIVFRRVDGLSPLDHFPPFQIGGEWRRLLQDRRNVHLLTKGRVALSSRLNLLYIIYYCFAKGRCSIPFQIGWGMISSSSGKKDMTTFFLKTLQWYRGDGIYLLLSMIVFRRENGFPLFRIGAGWTCSYQENRNVHPSPKKQSSIIKQIKSGM